MSIYNGVSLTCFISLLLVKPLTSSGADIIALRLCAISPFTLK